MTLRLSHSVKCKDTEDEYAARGGSQQLAELSSSEMLMSVCTALDDKLQGA